MGCEQSKQGENKKPKTKIIEVAQNKNINNANISRTPISNDVTKHSRIRSAKVAQSPNPQKDHDAKDKEKEEKRPELVRRSTSLMLQERYGKEKLQLLGRIRQCVVGINATFDGPFGRQKVIYCDFVASGKPVTFIEDYINNNVLPFYANTHTTTSVSALQTSTFREESRDIIKYCINATDEDVVIFTGSGSTSAIHKLINAIQLRGEKAERTVVIIGPHEHHSNILPWRVSGAKVDRIKETWHGELDIQDLREKLQTHTVAGLDVIVALSAASNVTGIKTDAVRIAELVHEYGGLSFWDYACAGPYLEVNMNPSPTGYKDAVFVSAHKFLGGPGTPGILMAKKSLFSNAIPGGVGGGTVAYVTKEKEHYLSNIEEREEGGTPAIVESIRAGLAFQLKQEIGSAFIESIEDDLCKRAFKVWKKNTSLQILGSHTAERLPIFSLLISHPQSKKFLHHNFVSILLNDLYGIQARGGCACAGPYAMDLLCITDQIERQITEYLIDKDANGNKKTQIESLKPGFARLNFPFFHDMKTVDFIIKAVDQVATYGWKLMPLYKFDPYSGSWEHRLKGRPAVAHLRDATLIGKRLRVTEATDLYNSGEVNLQEVLAAAEKTFDQALELSKDLNLDDEEMPIPLDSQSIIWFLQPKVALMHLRTPGLQYFSPGNAKLPFHARRNTLTKVRKQFINALDHLGIETNKLRVTPTFFAGAEADEKTEEERVEEMLSETCLDKSCT